MAAEGTDERPRARGRVPSKLRYVEAERIVCATVALKRVHRCGDSVATVSSRGIQLWSDSGLELSEHLPLSITSSLRRGNYLFLAQADRSVLVWELAPWRQAGRLEAAHKSKISGMAFVESHLYACGTDGRLAAWDVDLFENKKLRRARHPVFEIEEDDSAPPAQPVTIGASKVAPLGSALHCIAAVPDGLAESAHSSPGVLAVGSEDGEILYVSAEDLAVVATVQAHLSPVMQLTYFEEKRLLFSSSGRSRICGWKAGTSDRILKVRTKGNVQEMVVKKDYLYATSGDKIIRCSIITGKRATALVGHTGDIVRLRATKNCLFSGAVDGTLRQWDLSSGKCITVFVGHLLSVRDFHVYPTPTVRGPSMPQRSCSEAVGKKTVINMRGSDSLLFNQSVQRSGSGSYAVSVYGGKREPREDAAKPRKKKSGDEAPPELIILTASDDTTWRRWKTQDGTLTELEELLLEEEKLEEEPAPAEETVPFSVFGARSMGHVGPGMAKWSKLSEWEYTGNLSSPDRQTKTPRSPRSPKEGIHAPSNTPRMLSDSDHGSRPSSPGGVRWDRRFEYLSRSPRMLALSNLTAPFSPRDNMSDDGGMPSDGCDSCGSVSGDEQRYQVPFSSPKGYPSIVVAERSPVPEAAAAMLAVNPSAALTLSRKGGSPRRRHSRKKPFDR